MGLGKHLILMAFRWAYDQGYTHWVARTAEVGSNSKPGKLQNIKHACNTHWVARTVEVGSNSKEILIRLGGKVLPFVQDVTTEGHAAGSRSQSERRIWLYGETKPWARYEGPSA